MQLRIFIVEDSPIMRGVLNDLLVQAGADVVGQADNAAQAIRDIKRLDPDAIIVDIGLRRGTGFDVLRALERDERPGTRVVLTNYLSEPYRRAAARFGAMFFDKSCQIPDAVRCVMAHA